MESMATTVVLLVLVAQVLHTVQTNAYERHGHLERQQEFNKLVSIADYTVKIAGAYEGDEAIYPNWIDEQKLAQLDRRVLAERMGLAHVEVGWQPAEGTCIYRVVVVGEHKEIARLFVCGG